MGFLFNGPAWPHRVDGGVLLLLAALFLASVLAHRYWRAKIRLEDEVEAQGREALRSFERYRAAFRAMPFPAAFADRATGLVMEATPGWDAEGLPETGDRLYAGDAALEAAWNAIPPPSEDDAPAPPQDLDLGGRTLRALCLGGASLGVVLVVPARGR